MSAFAEAFASSLEPTGAPAKGKAAKRRATNRNAAKRNPAAAAPHSGSAPTLPRAATVMLQGVADGKTLGDCSLSYSMGQLMVEVHRPGHQVGGMYAVDYVPIGEWFVLADGRGVPLPVAIQRTRMDAYRVRVDSAPLRGLRSLTAYSTWVPSAQASSNPQQQRQNDQAAVRALQSASGMSHQAAMYTAQHLHS